MGRIDLDASARGSAPGEHDAVAFAVFARALAVGSLIHAWQLGLPPASVGPLLVAAALAVLVRPSAGHFMLLMVALAADFLNALPDPWNHLALLGLLAIAAIAWWLALVVRSRAAAFDPVTLLRNLGPFLRTGFIMAWAFAAIAKYNDGFLDGSNSCAVWIAEGIPFVRVPSVGSSPLIVGTVVIETAIPILLLLRPTRFLGVTLGLAFHLVSAFAGHAAFSGLAWALYLLFLPPETLVRCADTARAVVRRPEVPRILRAHPVVAIGLLTAGWMIAVGLVGGLDSGAQWQIRRWGAALPCVLWLSAWIYPLALHRATWFRFDRGAGGLRVHDGLLVGGLVLVAVAGMAPYLGLRTTASFTMYSDLRTEPGHWNHLFMPEAIRVFGWQDGNVRFIDTDDPELAEAIAALPEGATVVNHARRIAAAFPSATIRYELDGEMRIASPVSADDVLGRPLRQWERLLGGYRPFGPAEACLH